MIALHSLLAACCIGAAVALPQAPPTPTPTPSQQSYISMRIIGNGNSKIFEGVINNGGGNVILETQSGGTHYCGYATNGGALPGGAPAVALSVVASKKKIKWDATWDGENYQVTTIGSETAQPSWGLYVNGNTSTSQASCDTSFHFGDNEVLWIDNPSQYQNVLYLNPVDQREATDKPFQVTVTDYITGKPVQGAQIVGVSKPATTDENGNATVELDDCGPYTIRAKKASSADSNSIEMISDPYEGNKKRCV